MNREYWLEWENLTKKDIEMLISAIHPYLVDMEDKNRWDVAINEEGFQTLIYQAFFQMIEVLERILDPERKENIDFYCYYPKINQLLNYENDIIRIKSSVQGMMDIFHTTTIYDTVEHWWRSTAAILD